MRWKAQEHGSLVWWHGWAASKGGPETEPCKELKPAPKWPEESSADRTLTSVHHRICTLTMPSYKLLAHCSFPLFARVSLQSASMQAALTSSPCCRREQGLQGVAHRVIYHYEDFLFPKVRADFKLGTDSLQSKKQNQQQNFSCIYIKMQNTHYLWVSCWISLSFSVKFCCVASSNLIMHSLIDIYVYIPTVHISWYTYTSFSIYFTYALFLRSNVNFRRSQLCFHIHFHGFLPVFSNSLQMRSTYAN